MAVSGQFTSGKWFCLVKSYRGAVLPVLLEAATFLYLYVASFLSDPEYKKFLENYNGDEEKLTSTPETLLEELEAKSKELVGK